MNCVPNELGGIEKINTDLLSGLTMKRSMKKTPSVTIKKPLTINHESA